MHRLQNISKLCCQSKGHLLAGFCHPQQQARHTKDGKEGLFKCLHFVHVRNNGVDIWTNCLSCQVLYPQVNWESASLQKAQLTYIAFHTPIVSFIFMQSAPRLPTPRIHVHYLILACAALVKIPYHCIARWPSSSALPDSNNELDHARIPFTLKHWFRVHHHQPTWVDVGWLVIK